MNIWSDERVVLTLDAGGTNFVFSAIKGGIEIVDPIRKPSNANDLELCLKTIIKGFQETKDLIKEKPIAISFAFPGPADYRRGIIGDLPNLPAFRGGVALGPMLEEHFNIPVFINNDGDLFAYGEALGGILPEINKRLQEANSPKQYSNLVGITLGTGFGGGLVQDGNLFIGDNSIASEVWLTSSRLFPERFAEEGISKRAIQRVYYEYAKNESNKSLMPKDIYEIAKDENHPNNKAAKMTFRQFGSCLGDSLANLLTITDSIAVIGGGLSGASDVYMPAVMEEINGQFHTTKGLAQSRLVQKVYHIDNESEFRKFIKDCSKTITIPGTNKRLKYDPEPRLAICSSKLGASKAIGVGAYAFALNEVNRREKLKN
ncbi:ROK family protein [Ancylomarina euxinus]|uniref:ROK family protein n=1 Tax=Ancylomarina euxinus TaxID=2283627 RepID=A0A425XXL1_9BACT|nr:ROK family protein [Ancylomarina euxinus]MCZ4694723.1 ROK family protein [Ancylomarina euxinus]MUP16387.1 ROK family protein [Ancylomarina euxinus]RRG19418.1 ROK family protein [Ancylomarina euxinus]